MKHAPYRPRAREQALLVESLDEELLVFDERRARAHSLNETAARVWRACDGERDIYALQVECALDAETLQLALDRLRTAGLLDEPEGPDHVSRRAILKRSVAAGTALGVAVPVIRSITAPTPAMAASASKHPPNGFYCGPAGSNWSPGSVCVGPTGAFCARGPGASCYRSDVCEHDGSTVTCPSTRVCP